MNNKLYLLILCFASNLSPLCAATSPSLIETIITYPPEITLESDIPATAEGFLQLDQKRIDELHAHYEKNFKMRGYLKYGSRALQVGLVGVGLYNMGLLDFLLPGNISLSPQRPNDIDFLKKDVAKLMAKVFNDNPSSTRLAWLWSSVKSVSQWVTFSLCLAKATQLYSYVEAQPTFVWFFGNHSLSDRVDVLRRSVKAITDFNIPADYSLEYHKRAIVPALQSIAHNVEELIAFMDYYFDAIDQDFLINQGMDMQSRYMFNISNDFFKNIHCALQDPSKNAQAVMLIDDFRNDVITVIKRCQFFEKEFVQED